MYSSLSRCHSDVSLPKRKWHHRAIHQSGPRKWWIAPGLRWMSSSPAWKGEKAAPALLCFILPHQPHIHNPSLTRAFPPPHVLIRWLMNLTDATTPIQNKGKLLPDDTHPDRIRCNGRFDCPKRSCLRDMRRVLLTANDMLLLQIATLCVVSFSAFSSWTAANPVIAC